MTLLIGQIYCRVQASDHPRASILIVTHSLARESARKGLTFRLWLDDFSPDIARRDNVGLSTFLIRMHDS